MVNKRFHRRWTYPLLSVVIALGICLQPLVSQASLLDLLPRVLPQVIQVFQLSNMSDSQEVEIGQQINQELTSGQVKISRDANLTRYVDQIGQRLAAQSDRPRLPYTFQVVDDNSINAFATMGGFVYVNTGLLKAADNEAQLASVMGHEIGHIAGRHAVKQMRETAIARGLLGAAGLDRSTAVNIGVELAFSRPNSRRDEFDADERGLRTMSRAGYAQSEMVAFMQKLLNASSTPTFLSRHPATPDRITRLRDMIRRSPTAGRDGLDATSYRRQVQALR